MLPLMQQLNLQHCKLSDAGPQKLVRLYPGIFCTHLLPVPMLPLLQQLNVQHAKLFDADLQKLVRLFSAHTCQLRTGNADSMHSPSVALAAASEALALQAL